MALIHLDNVGVEFISRTGRVSIKELAVNWWRRERFSSHIRRIQALRNLSIQVEPGQRVGIIGKNGAGKSTLLRVMAGIYPPTSGQRYVKGKIGSLFDVALGFEDEATGWENIAYRGYLQGETPATIRGKIDKIAEFSELGDFLDLPLRHYSPGMRTRLAFSIATTIEPEVLLVDEVLSAGDAAFQLKARARINEMIQRSKIVIAVSHDMGSLARLCNHVIWLETGQIRMQGPAQEVIDAYQDSADAEASGVRSQAA